MKTGIIQVDDEYIYLQRKGIRGYLAFLLEKIRGRKFDQEIGIKKIGKADINPGIKNIMRPYVILYYIKNTAPAKRIVMFPAISLGGDKDYDLFIQFLHAQQIPLQPTVVNR